MRLSLRSKFNHHYKNSGFDHTISSYYFKSGRKAESAVKSRFKRKNDFGIYIISSPNP